MKVLVVENEVYLAQSIAAKLQDAGYACEFAATTREALEHRGVDVLLLSSNFSDQYFHLLIEQYREKIIILMVSYINADTVTRPMNAGASDYILKPFMIEELIRKIEHFKEFRRIKNENRGLLSYVAQGFEELRCDGLGQASETPLLLITNHQRCADAYAFKLASQKRLSFFFHPLNGSVQLPALPKGALIYLSGLQTLKKNEKRELAEQLRKLPVVMSSTDDAEEAPAAEFRIRHLKSQSQGLGEGELLSIEEYVKLAILSNQNRYPDTELSKRLGISRKSLWEKRKKYGILKNSDK
ncbi:MAG: response regulator [Campylobacterales bacterium]